MAGNEYVQIEDEEGVYASTDALSRLCDHAVESSRRMSGLIQEKHALFAQAREIARSLINEIHVLNEYMDKTTGRPKNAPKPRLKKVAVRTQKKATVKKAVKSGVSKKSSKSSMKALQSNIKKIKKALK